MRQDREWKAVYKASGQGKEGIGGDGKTREIEEVAIYGREYTLRNRVENDDGWRRVGNVEKAGGS